MHIMTGNGAGKTTSALGAALRAAGHRQKVVMVQFMKGRKDTGEFKAQKQLKTYKVHQFGTKGFVNLYNPSAEDVSLAKQGLEFVAGMKNWPDVLILDEICLAAAIGLLDVHEIINVLKKMPARTAVFMTGRSAPNELMHFADYVNRTILVKMPRKIRCKKGIEY